MMAIDRHREGRLTRRLYETTVVFAFATLIALSLLLAVGLRTQGRFSCTTKSIVAASAHCAGAAEIERDLPSTVVNVVFSADTSLANAER